jgi:streptogramin lyase
MNSKVIIAGVTLLLFLAAITLRPPIAKAQSTYITEYPVPTPNAGPLAVAVDRNDNVWFTESNAFKLAVFFPSNDTFREIPVGISDLEMWGLTIDPDGRVWFTGHNRVTGQGYVSYYDVGLERFASFEFRNGTFPMRVLYGDDGNLWVTLFSGNELAKLNPQTEEIDYFDTPGTLTGPAGLTWDSAGKLWVSFALSNQIASFDPHTESFTTYSPPVVGSPVGIATDERANVWVADHGGNWILRFNPSNKLFERFPTSTPPREAYPISIPNELKIDSRGLVWFAEHGGNKIAYVDPMAATLVEYTIPTGPISTVLWFDFDSQGNVWFAEFDGNKLGKLVPARQLPFSLSLETPSVTLVPGGSAATQVKISLDTGQGSPTTLALLASDAGIDLHSEFTAPIWRENTASAQVRFSLDQDARPGTKRIAITASDGSITVGAYLDLTVVASTSFDLPLNAPILVGSLALAGAIALFAYSRLKMKRRPGD